MFYVDVVVKSLSTCDSLTAILMHIQRISSAGKRIGDLCTVCLRVDAEIGCLCLAPEKVVIKTAF